MQLGQESIKKKRRSTLKKALPEVPAAEMIDDAITAPKVPVGKNAIAKTGTHCQNGWHQELGEVQEMLLLCLFDYNDEQFWPCFNH